jgi:hypothetical protein
MHDRGRAPQRDAPADSRKASALRRDPAGAQRLLELQRSVGNSAVAAHVARASLTEAAAAPAPGIVQRKNFFQKLWSGIKNVFAPKASPQKKVDKPHQDTTPKLEMDLASGEAVLKNAFGSMKTIVPGKIEILDQAGFQAAYDKIYGSGDYSWDKYVKPKYGNLNGFANAGVNYINKTCAGLHTVVHEMLHNNCANDWTPFVGSRWNEGTTEILTQVACKKLSVDAPVCYPGESPCVQAALDAGLPLENLEQAYLNGGAKEKVGDWVDANCKENWAAVKTHMEANDWAAAKAGLAKK